MKIKEFFKDKEIACPCCGKLPDYESVRMLYALRLLYNKPIKILSGRRCILHNISVGGSPHSAHLTGAYDCKIPPEDEFKFIQLAMNVGFTGIGINNNVSIHLDDKHEHKTIWTY